LVCSHDNFTFQSSNAGYSILNAATGLLQPILGGIVQPLLNGAISTVDGVVGGALGTVDGVVGGALGTVDGVVGGVLGGVLGTGCNCAQPQPPATAPLTAEPAAGGKRKELKE